MDKDVWRKFRVVYEYEAREEKDGCGGTLKLERSAWKDHEQAILGDKLYFRKIKFTIEEVK